MARLASGRTTALTAAEIVDVALRQVDEGGLDKLTMGNIAAELNVSQMALYRHFDSKGHLLRGVLDRVWSEGNQLSEIPSDPVELMVASALAMWSAFARHPQIGVMLGATPEPTPQSMTQAALIEKVMIAAGFDPDHLDRAYMPIATYILGSIALLGSRVAARGAMVRVSPEDAREYFHSADITEGRDVLLAMVPDIDEAEASFERGLRALIGGLLAEQPRRAEPAD